MRTLKLVQIIWFLKGAKTGKSLPVTALDTRSCWSILHECSPQASGLTLSGHAGPVPAGPSACGQKHDSRMTRTLQDFVGLESW